MKRLTRLWMVAACAVLSAPAWAQTRWEPVEAGAAKMDLPANRIASLDALPPGSVSYYGKVQGKAAGAWQMTLPDGGQLQVAGWTSQTHPNGDVTWSGYVDAAGGSFPVLLTQGAESSFGTLVTPQGRFRFEGRDNLAWLVREDHPRMQILPPDADALDFIPQVQGSLTKAPQPVAQAVGAKAAGTQIDVLFLYTDGMASRFPGSMIETRVNHLVAVANQVFANSAVDVALRLVGVDRVSYTDQTTNEEAIDDLRVAVQPSGLPVNGLLNMRQRRIDSGADLITLVRPHDVETRSSCGAAYLFDEAAYLGVNVMSDGVSSWSVCGDDTFAHNIGHNLGAEHQNGANTGDAGSATALVRPGQFHTVMAAFRTGDDDYGRTLLRFSNPQQRCGNAPCGVAGVSDNAARVRSTASAVAAYQASTTTIAAVTLPAPLDADVDGDGVPESLDAFPFDPANSNDRDRDGVADGVDRFPDLASESIDTDSDGTGDNSDSDIDGDGVPNSIDALPLIASESTDADSDGVGDTADAFDADPREWGDLDRDGRGDNVDPDTDGDGIQDFAGFDLLVASKGTDRVVRLDGASGRFVAVEMAEDHAPVALAPYGGLAYNAYRRRAEALIASEVHRYDGAGRKLEARVLRAHRGDLAGLRTGLTAAIAVAPDGTLYAADGSSRSLHRYDSVSAEEVPGGVFGDRLFFSFAPRAMQVHANMLWTLEKNGRISVVSLPDGAVVRRMSPTGGTGLSLPVDATAFVFGPDGSIYLADAALDYVAKMNPETGQLTPFVTTASGGLDRPSGLAFDAQGRLYVSSAGTNKVLRYAASGAFLDVFSQAPAGSLSDPRALLFVPHISDRYPRDATKRYRPRVGVWSDPTRSGQGLDIQALINGLSVAWYTYEEDGRATWYLATGALQGNVFQAPLQRVTWNGSSATATPVGTIELEFTGEDTAQMRWALGAQNGIRTISHFVTADSLEAQFPSAVWYAPLSSGWGFSITRLGGLQSVISFVFDTAGQPTWALGVGTSSDEVFQMRRLNAPGACPACAGGAAPTSAAVGTVRFDVVDFTHADGAIDLSDATLNWKFPALDLLRLSETPTQLDGDPR
jgi:hypothetical protein